MSPYWPNEAFFPPPDKFTLITGFKKACSAFGLLAKEAERLLRNQNINKTDFEEIFRSKDEDRIRIKRLAIGRRITLDDFHLLIPRCPNLVSLSFAFSERSLGPQAVLKSYNLIRLDLEYENIWWRGPTLDFPNLRELRLSSVDPLVTDRWPVYISLKTTDAERFAANLVNTVRKLQRLKLLSVHVVLDDSHSIVKTKRSVHRLHRMADRDSPENFSICKYCIEQYRKKASWHAELVRSREAKLSAMLAEKLPGLEKVLWMDAWNGSFCDEEGMRESNIIRMKDGNISVKIQGEIVPPLKTFSFTL
ncbi:hypothetical protein A7U60_g7556 [Sanghuangporus baumii]|uniref:Uncharacterized protein n=1 Tax=Sanghuangporus baumii TaxID=108892 RepID=A0A9Q5N573_SANBA|nr:hypothetical protein A7U60_g7556 [Sanghuangporus baumii]